LAEQVTGRLFMVVARFTADDIPLLVDPTEKACVDFVLRHSVIQRLSEVRVLAEQRSQRCIPSLPIGFDIYQLLPELKILSSDDLPDEVIQAVAAQIDDQLAEMAAEEVAEILALEELDAEDDPDDENDDLDNDYEDYNGYRNGYHETPDDDQDTQETLS
jgi:hypothetical protein